MPFKRLRGRIFLIAGEAGLLHKAYDFVKHLYRHVNGVRVARVVLKRLSNTGSISLDEET